MEYSTELKRAILPSGELVYCTVCKHDRFEYREAQLNTATATFFKLDWANESAACLTCNSCGHILWFLK